MRSPMAEALANTFYGDAIVAASAGVQAAGWIHPYAADVMTEIGVEMQHAVSRSLEAFRWQRFDTVILLSRAAAERYRDRGKAHVEVWPVEDPRRVNDLRAFRETRDELSRRIQILARSIRARRHVAISQPSLQCRADRSCASHNNRVTENAASVTVPVTGA